jgi:hypothetical protein
MRVAIEMNELRVTHVHTDAEILSGLVYLECAKLECVIFDNTESDKFLDGLTTLELNKLYNNMTGKDFPPAFDDLMRRDALASVFETLQPQKAKMDELEAQIEAVLDNLEAPPATAIQFKYVYGARVPRILEDGLFPLSVAPATSEQLMQAQQSAAQRRKLRPATLVAPAMPKRAQRPAAGPRTPTGGARPVIFVHADRVWEEAGKPTNKQIVLELRKRMMVELEEKGIKKTTSSTALGDWMKQRLQ